MSDDLEGQLIGYQNGGRSVPARVPALTLDWLLSLRLDFTEAEKYRYCEALVDILRPRCSFGIVGTWDLMNATAEEHAEAYLKVKLNEEKSE